MQLGASPLAARTTWFVFVDSMSATTRSFRILDWFVTESFVQSLFRSLSESFVPVIQQILRVHPAPSDDIERHLTFFQSTLFRYLGEESLWDVYRSLLPEIFLLGSLIDE